MSAWKIIVQACFPPPVIFLGLLLLPLPRKWERGVLRMVNNGLELPILATFKLLHVMLALTGYAFLASARQTAILGAKSLDAIEASPNVHIGMLAKKWRAERNFWISGFCFSMWMILAGVYKILTKKVELEDRVIYLEQVAKGGEAPTRPAAIAGKPSRGTGLLSALRSLKGDGGKGAGSAAHKSDTAKEVDAAPSAPPMPVDASLTGAEREALQEALGQPLEGTVKKRE